MPCFISWTIHGAALRAPVHLFPPALSIINISIQKMQSSAQCGTRLDKLQGAHCVPLLNAGTNLPKRCRQDHGLLFIFFPLSNSANFSFSQIPAVVERHNVAVDKGSAWHAKRETAQAPHVACAVSRLACLTGLAMSLKPSRKR